MEEEFITLETSKLAKEKRFDNLVCTKAYGIDGIINISPSTYKELKESGDLDNGIIPAPSQSLLQKWLREKHNIDIIIEPDIIHKADKYYCYRIRFNMNCAKLGGVAPTYEDALEASLQEALKLINP